MTAPLLAFDGVTCVRGERVLFETLDFALAPGGALVARGPNGSGKSSLIRIAAGLLPAMVGAVRCEGDRALMVADAPALDPEVPVARALAFWAEIDGVDADAVAAALVTVGLAHLAEVPVRLLSTGQRRRATLARVIAGGADIWLLDEPANGLDVQSVRVLEAEIARHRGGGGVVVVATHLPMALPDAVEIGLGDAR